MRRLAGVIAFALLVVGLGGSSAGSTVVASANASAVLALVSTYNGARLVWLDPATLRTLPRPSVTLPGGAWSPILSPASRYVALGGLGTIGVKIVDLRRMKVGGRVAAARYSNRRLVPLAWPERRRLLVLDSPQDAQGARQRLLVIDPVSGKTIARRPAAKWVAWAAAGRKLVVLERSEASTEQVRLVALGPAGDVLGAADIFLTPDQRTIPPGALPGFAVDGDEGLAFLVGSDTVTRVDLETLEVAHVRVSQRRSLFALALGWLEPAAQAKPTHPYVSRQVTSLGSGLLAVSGTSFETTRSVPSGLELVDTQAGSRRTIEPRAPAHHFAHGLLLAFGAGWEPTQAAARTSTGMGLSAFAPDGARLWSALGDEPVWLVETAGGYAYVPTPEEAYPVGVRVIDLATGAVLRTVRAELPVFLPRS